MPKLHREPEVRPTSTARPAANAAPLPAVLRSVYSARGFFSRLSLYARAAVREAVDDFVPLADWWWTATHGGRASTGDAERLVLEHTPEIQAALSSLGLTRMRARPVQSLARAVADGALALDRSADPEATREGLLALPGIGPWTAAYIAMRALGWPDAFPAGDLGLRKALGGISTAECEARSQKWRPWRAYAAAHLWMGLSEETG